MMTLSQIDPQASGTLSLLGTEPPMDGGAPVFSPWATADADREKRARQMEKLDAALLDPETFFKKNPFNPAFAPDVEAAKRRVLVAAALRVENGGKPLPMGADGHELMRRRVAALRFDGRGAEDDNAFHGELVKAAQGRKDQRAITQDLEASASLAEFSRLPDTTAGKSVLRNFAAWKKQAAGKPGYDPAAEPDYFEAWTQVQRDVKDKVDAFRPELESVFTAFQRKEDYAAAAWDAWAKLPEDQRKPFLAALKVRASALSQQDQDGFFVNFFKSTGRDVGALLADTATAGKDLGLTMDYRANAPAGVAIPAPSGMTDAQSRAAHEQSRADFRQRSNFVADVVALQQNTYDPIRYLADPGAMQRIEKIAYGAPGVLASSGMALVSAPALTLSLTESHYQSIRQRMLDSGKSDAEADRIAGGLAPVAGAVEMFSERLGSELLLGKLPFLEKSLGRVIDKISNPILRTVLRGAAGTAEEGLQEVAQNYIDPLVQDIGAALSADVPDVQWTGKGGEFDGDFSENLDSFLSCAPLVIFGMAGAVSKDARVKAFRDASDTELRAIGIKDVPALRSEIAKGMGSGDAAIEEAMTSRDATSEDAKAAVAELKAQQASQARAAADLERLGYASPRFVQTQDGISVVDNISGDEIGHAPDLSGAIRIARTHTAAMDDLTDDQIARLGTMMEAARVATELDPNSAQDVGFDTNFDPAQESSEQARRYAAQVALKEQAEGGTGNIARSVLGYSETEFAQGLRTTVNRLFRGATVKDVFHELFHGLRRGAHAKGVLTVKDDIAELRRRDAILKGRVTKENVAMQFIPDGITDEMLETGNIPEEMIPAEFNGDGKRYAATLIDEGISEIAELETLKTRQGTKHSKLRIGGTSVHRNMLAATRLSLAPESNFKAFMRAVKARFGLALSRAHSMLKAERDGTFDKTGSDAYLNKLLGLDEQQAHDDGVRAELNRIMALPEFDPTDDIPFSIGRAETSVFAEATKPMATVKPMIGAFGREIGMTSGNGWDAGWNMSRNAARAIEEGKMPLPEFKDWLAETLGVDNVPEIAIRRGNDAAGNHFREYHHMGKNRREVDFYDPEDIGKSPKFFLGMAAYFDTLKTGKKAAAASRKQALQAWKNLKQALIDEGVMGDWKGSATKDVRNKSSRMEALPERLRQSVSAGRMTIDEAEVKAFQEATAALEKEAATLKASVDKRQSQIAKWTKKIEAGEKPPYDGYLASQESGLAADAEKLAAVVEQLQKRTPAESADAGRKMDESRASSLSGFESRQSLGPQDGSGSGMDASGFSLGPADVPRMTMQEFSDQESKDTGFFLEFMPRQRQKLAFVEALAKIKRRKMEPLDVMLEKHDKEWMGDSAAGHSQLFKALVKAGLVIDQPADFGAFSLGPADVPAIMEKSALSRIRDPRRRTQAMQRIARDFNSMRLQIDRLLALSGRKRSKAELRMEANAREDLRAEELIAEVHARFGSILHDEDLTKIKSQPVHAWLADPETPLRGRLMSKAAAIKAHPERYQLHRGGEYDGSEAVSRSVFGGMNMPDQMAQELFDHGLIHEPTPDAMWEALLAEQNTVARNKEFLAKAMDQIREAKAEAKREATEWLQTQGKDQETNFNPREEILRSLRMLDAILLAMPPEVRGKVGGYTQMARITTDEAKLSFLKDKLAKADKELEIFLRAEFGKEFEDLMKRARPSKDAPGERPSGNIDPDAWEIFKIADAATHWKFVDAEAEATKWDTKAEHEDTTPEDAVKFRAIAQVIRLVQNWEGADAARREMAVKELEGIFYGGLDKLRRTISARMERVGILRSSALTGTKKAGDRMEIKEAKKQSGKLAWEIMSFGQVVNVLFGEDSAAARWFNAREIAASNALEDSMQVKANALESLFETLAGSRFGGEKLRHRMQSEESIKVTDALGNPQTFTESEAITFLLMWRQEDGARHMRGIQDETGGVVSSWAWDESSAAEIERQLSPAGQQMLAFLGDSYGEEYTRINDVFRRIWHVSMPRHKMYAPLTVKATQAKADTILDPVSGDTMGVGMTPGSLKNRSQTAVAEPDFRDAFQVYYTHARQMEHFIAYGEFARDALAIVNRRDTRNAIEAAGGKIAMNTLGRWLDFFALGGIRDANMGSEWMQTVGRMLGRLSQAALVGRISVLAMQSMQLAAAAYKMPLGAFLTRFAKLQAGRLSWGDAIRSPYIQRRIAEMPPVVRDMIRGMEAGTPNRLKFLAAMGGKTISGADALFTAGTYAIFYDYHLKQNGGDTAAAHAEAERLTDQVAQPVRPGARSMLELANSGNPAFRALWNFSSDPRQKASIIVYEMMRRDKSKGEKAAAAGKAIAITWGVTGILQAVLRAVLRDLRSGDDDEIFDERHWNLKRLALQAITGPLGAMPFFGEMIEGASYKLTGSFMPGGTLLDALGDAVGLVPKWMKGKFDALEDAERMFTGGAVLPGTAGETSAAAASGAHLLRDAWGIISNMTN